MSVVFDKAEAAWGLLKAIETHDQPLDLSTFGKELMNLFFSGIEGKIAHIESGGILQRIVFFGRVFIGIISTSLLVLDKISQEIGRREEAPTLPVKYALGLSSLSTDEWTCAIVYLLSSSVVMCMAETMEVVECRQKRQ
jgi:hypothetical protein